MTTAAEERTELSGNLLVGVFEMNTTDTGRVHDQGRGERGGPHRPHRVPPQYNGVRGATIYLSKYMMEAIQVSEISQYWCNVIIIINMHVHLSSLWLTELVNGLACCCCCDQLLCYPLQVSLYFEVFPNFFLKNLIILLDVD